MDLVATNAFGAAKSDISLFCLISKLFFFFKKKNGPTTASFSFIFGLFKQTIQVLQQNHCEKCHIHPVYSATIQTHDLRM